MRWILPASLLGCGCGEPEPETGDCHDCGDLDRDGWTSAEDCDDEDPARGGPELPYDGVDNDCDLASPDDDLDGDGLLLAEDCDDGDPTRGGPEVLEDGVDNDCDGGTDCEDPEFAED